MKKTEQSLTKNLLSTQNEARQEWLSSDQANLHIESSLETKNEVVRSAVYKLLTSQEEDQQKIIRAFKNEIVDAFIKTYVSDIGLQISRLSTDKLSSLGLKVKNGEYKLVNNCEAIKGRLNSYGFRVRVYQDFGFSTIESWNLENTNVKNVDNKLLYNRFKYWYNPEV